MSIKTVRGLVTGFSDVKLESYILREVSKRDSEKGFGNFFVKTVVCGERVNIKMEKRRVTEFPIQKLENHTHQIQVSIKTV